MQRVAEERHGLLSLIKENYSLYMKNYAFAVQPQMPTKQVSHFIKQAVRKQRYITIQINPSHGNQMLTEATGIAQFSPHTSQIILTSPDKKTVHFIHAQSIRHIRLAND
jgi:hypothetical protein